VNFFSAFVSKSFPFSQPVSKRFSCFKKFFFNKYEEAIVLLTGKPRITTFTDLALQVNQETRYCLKPT
jgi:hypothetical protein